MMYQATYYIFAVQCLLIVPIQSMNSTQGEGSNDCPIWMRYKANNTCICEKSQQKENGRFKCNSISKSLQIMACYCVSYYEVLNMTVVGNCLYSCSRSYHYDVEAKSPNETCNKFNRVGELCGKCAKGKGNPLYSYNMTCIECTHTTWNWILYIFVAFFPLTVFYVIVIIFRISVASERLSSYVLMSQILSTPTHLRYITTLSGSSLTKNIAISLYAICNLDFFKSLYTPFCSSESMSMLSIVSLDYIIALYPLYLIFLTYILTKLHDKFDIVRCMWRPFHQILSRMRHHWNIKKSLVDAFVTFVLLSYIKILNASFDILLPTNLYNMSGHLVSRQYLYYDGTQREFSNKHLAHAILAVVMVLVFNVAPLVLLLLYPCRFFQVILNRCNQSRFQILLHTVMDTFQGHYKTLPLDCRYFAAIGLVARIANLILFSLTQSRFYYIFGSILFMCLSGLTIAVRPYKSSKQNTINGLLYLLFAFGYVSSSGYALSIGHEYDKTLLTFVGASLVISLFYPILLILQFLISPTTRICRMNNTNSPDYDALLHSPGERKPLLQKNIN